MPENVDKEPIENMVVIQDLESHLNKHIPLHELDELANCGVYFTMGYEKQDKVMKTCIGKLRTSTRIPKFKWVQIKLTRSVSSSSTDTKVKFVEETKRLSVSLATHLGSAEVAKQPYQE